MSARRGKGEGAVTLRRDGRWEARLTLDPKGGKRQRRAFYGKTRAEAVRKMREAQAKCDANLPLPSEKLTVRAYLTEWLDGRKGTLRAESWRRYDEQCRLYLIPELGRHKVAKLEPAHVRSAYGRLSERLSGTSLNLMHGTLHVALRDAEREGIVGRNVASLVTAPRRSTGEMKHLGPEDAKDLLGAAKDSPLEAFFTVALLSGLRLGELQALRWSDVDMGRRRLVVRRTLTGMMDGEPVFGDPKTKNSRRTVWLADAAVEALERHVQIQDGMREKAGPAWREYGLVFTSAVGTPLDGNNVRERHFADLLKAAGLPKVRFHDLRHTAATLLLSQGVPVKVVSEMLGHADVTVTLKVYAHVIEGSQGQAIAVMDKLFHS